MTYCCDMRRRFLIGLVAENKDAPQPKGLADFIVDWDRPVPIIGIKFCPFCGVEIDHRQQELRSIDPRNQT